ncbi:MAG: NAD(P)H-hydrate dehydratase [Rubrimonas sp.]|uniref:NAD(P)H-hydrate dehydratase n=1 Tax=Rubrimonas sp. TaxID=2036015 RepID=UPI002FDD3A8A
MPTLLIAPDALRALETSAIAADPRLALKLMERAGAALAREADAMGFATRGRAAVFCGPGANGGDGYVAARHLAQMGWEVACFALGDPARAPANAAEMARRWRETGPLRPFAADGPPQRFGLIVDALFGAGLARPLAPGIAEAWRAVAASGRVAAADAPSGLCLNTGRDFGAPAPAELTVTFHRAKPGHYLGAGPDLCGRLVVADIGLADADDVLALAEPDPALLAKQGGGHKYDHGHALVLGGGVGRGGAARLAARAALRAGAGLVTLAVPAAALIENAARLDAVMLRPLDAPEALAALLGDRRFTCVALGPGLGLGRDGGARARALALTALDSGRAAALDADALTAFAEDPAPLFAACAGRAAILTPHGGEFARLFPDLAARLAEGSAAFGRVEAARAAAARAQATVLLKGRTTVIAAPDGRTRLHPACYGREAPWLATAGAGDVLTGLIAGLMARGAAPLDAAASACWLHVEAARLFGPGLTADDLPDALPAALRRALGAAPQI